MKIPVINKSGTPSGFYQDANGRWHRPNGDFASNAEVGIASPAKTATESHGNSLSDPRTNYGYVLVDKDTNEILKFGETLYPETRYSKSYQDTLRVIWNKIMLL
jgi:rhs family protein